MIKLLKNNVKCQGHLKVKVIMLKGWLKKKFLEENETLTQIVLPDARLPTQTDSPIYKPKNLAIKKFSKRL